VVADQPVPVLSDEQNGQAPTSYCDLTGLGREGRRDVPARIDGIRPSQRGPYLAEPFIEAGANIEFSTSELSTMSARWVAPVPGKPTPERGQAVRELPALGRGADDRLHPDLGVSVLSAELAPDQAVVEGELMLANREDAARLEPEILAKIGQGRPSGLVSLKRHLRPAQPVPLHPQHPAQHERYAQRPTRRGPSGRRVVGVAARSAGLSARRSACSARTPAPSALVSLHADYAVLPRGSAARCGPGAKSPSASQALPRSA
jgi:hypothetical protein